MAAVAPIELPVANTRVGVMGLGVAGRAMAQTLAARGAQLTLVDENPNIASILQPLSMGAGSRMVLGPVPHDVFHACAWVALSPGVAPQHPALQHALRHNIPVVGEVELIGLVRPPPKTLAITGTNGKSTTTSLAGTLARALGLDVFVGGNLGDAIGGWVGQPPHERAAHGILELSSYQIDGLVHYRPDVAVVLNVTPDHLARYGTFEAYLSAKAQLVRALGPLGTAVLNADDEATCAMAPLCAGRVLWFTTAGALPAAAGPNASGMVLREGRAVPVGTVAEGLRPVALQHPVLIGAHNTENVMATLLALCAFAPLASGTETSWAPDPRALHEAYQSYAGLPHRLAPVATVAGVRYLNDSKATNDASAATAVRAMAGPYVLLVGGQDKGGGYRALLGALEAHPPKAVVTFGAAGPLLLRTLRAAALGSSGLFGVGTLQDACALAQQLSAAGDTVLLSPACTSFDAFTNYQARGDTFAAWVHAQQRP